jgi:alpha-methylacyl-CoA racemase
MERLRLGPSDAFAANPALVYARLTGFGQDGPLAERAGHDLTYLAWSGVLSAIGEKGRKPVPPLNLLADFGGGAMFLIAGVLAALVERQRSGKGQVVDAAMVDGAALLLGGIYGMAGAGLWNDNDRETNMLDGGAHFYGTYETKDGKFVCIGSIEPQFYAELLEKTGLQGESLPAQMDRKAWAQLKSRLAGIFRTKTRDEWCAIMEGTDICFAPVLTMKEASQHPHAKARGAYIDVSGFPQPAPAPRFSRTKESIKGPAAKRGQHTDEVLSQRGFSAKEIGELKAAGIVGPQ